MKYDFQLEEIDPNTAHGKVIGQITPGSTVLECGCATGYVTRFLSEKLGCEMYVVERDEEGFRLALPFAKDGTCADLMDDAWPTHFSDVKFDYITFMDVLEHTYDPKRVLELALPLLKDKGRILVSIPNVCHNDILMKLVDDDWEYTPLGLLDNTHIRFWGEKNLEDFFRSVGLEIVTMDYTLCPTTRSEQNFSRAEAVDPYFYEVLRKRPYGEVYQFILSLKKASADADPGERLQPVLQPSSLHADSLANLLRENEDLRSRCADYDSRVKSYEAQRLTNEEMNRAYALERQAFAQERIAFAQAIQSFETERQDYLRERNDFIMQRKALEEERNRLGSELDEALCRAKKAEDSLNEISSRLDKALQAKAVADRSLAQATDELQERTQQALGDRADILRLRAENEQYALRCYVYENSNSWKITKPYRMLGDFIKKLFGIRQRPVMLPKGSPVQHSDEAHDKKTELPLVTVAIPVYDRTDVLIASIESILAQTYPAVEIIAVCDGSPPETLEIIRAYERKGKIRAYYYADNSGNAVRGRNRAIQEARGEFVAFQDSDDIADPDRIRLSVETMQTEHCDVVYGGWRAMVEDRADTGLENGQEIFSPDCDFAMLREICVPCQSTVMVRTAALRKVGGLKTVMRYREDHELWLRLAYNGYKFKAIQKVLTNLRLHGNNLELTFKAGDDHWKELMLKEYTVIRPLAKRVVFLIPGCDISGGIKVVCSYANYLKTKGFYVWFVCTGPMGSLDWFPNQQVEILTIDQAPEDLDIVVSTFWTTNEYAFRLETRRRIYLVQSDERNFYDSNSLEAALVEKTYRRSGQEFVVIASWMKEWLFREFDVDATLLINGVDYTAYTQAQPLSPRNDRIRILIEGDPESKLKGVADAFRIAERSGAEIWYVKPTEGKSAFRADREFDHVSNDMMPSIYASCHILLKTSRYESFCLPALEMMAAGGVPVVARVNGLMDYLQDGVNGFIVEQTRLDDALERIQRLQNNPELLHSMGETARKTAAAFDYQKTLEKMYEFFNRPSEQEKEQ